MEGFGRADFRGIRLLARDPMAKATPATLALEKAGVAFKLHEYDYDPNAERIGIQAAEALGIEPARLLKTLMVRAGDAVVCVLAPSDREVNLKKLAQAAGAKSAATLGAAEAERISGYHVGGISPFGQKKRATRVHRAIGADVSAHRGQWRAAWVASRIGARRIAAGVGRDSRRCLLSGVIPPPALPTGCRARR